MANNTKYPLYELTPEVFERLCFDLLARSYQGFDFGIFGPEPGPDKGVDFVGTKDEAGKHVKVAVEIKHRTSLHPDGLRLFLQRFADYFSDFDELVIVTSSPITKTHREFVSLPSLKEKGVNVRLIGQSDIFELLEKNQDIAARYFDKVRDKVRKRKYAEYLSVLASVASVIGLILSLYSYNNHEETTSLDRQIDSVEMALKGVRSLEGSLSDLKGELTKTSKESEQIKKEYEEALKLKSVTADQLKQIRKAVSSQTNSEIVFNYLLGFLLGVGSSILGAVIYDRIRRFRALQNNEA